MRTLTTAVALTAILLIGGCANGEGDSEVDLDDPVDGPTADPDTDLETITGTLGGDAHLEGGCVWLDGDDDQRYEVMWPSGWEADADALEVRDGDGEVVAREGDQLTLRGVTATDVATVCQVGTPFEAEEVEAD